MRCRSAYVVSLLEVCQTFSTPKVLGPSVSTKVLNIADFRKWEASGTISEEQTCVILVTGWRAVAQGLVWLAVERASVTL